MEPLEALEAAGFTYLEDHMELEYDYPLSFFVRGDDWVLGAMTEEARGIKFILNPMDLHFEQYVEDESEIETFVKNFTKAFEEFNRIWKVLENS